MLAPPDQYVILVISNTNDGTTRPPRLRCDLNTGTLAGLPPWSAAPVGDPLNVYQAARAAGYEGMQGGDLALLKSLGMGSTAGGGVREPSDADPLAQRLKEAGHDCATLHVGWGMEDDDAADRLVDAVLAASHKHDFPLYIETHRATITQDMWRTVRLTRKFPQIRFNGDFSHWYTGLEMVYGGFEKKLEFIAPVLERVRFIHGRIGNPGCIQVNIGDGTNRPNVEHFKELWTRSFAGFLQSAKPGDYLCFAPELLWSKNYYARLLPAPDGTLQEESDRWEQALVLTRIARQCFEAARQRLPA